MLFDTDPATTEVAREVVVVSLASSCVTFTALGLGTQVNVLASST